MSSRAKKISKNPHNIASTLKSQSEPKLNQKKLKFGSKNDGGQCKNDMNVKNARENMSRGTGAIDKDKTNKEKNRLFYSSDEEPDDINNVYGENVSKSIQSLTRKNNMSVKERKFFKRNYPETPNVCLSPRSVELQEENVTKVFKILSKSVSTPVLTESKSIKKLPLKTYSTPKTTKTKVIESFGLPDNPIVSSLPAQYDGLDVGVTDAKEVTVFDVPFFEVEELLPVKQYDKPFNTSSSNVESQDENSPQKNTSPNHLILIEKMKNQIRKLLCDSPTLLKGTTTSTPIKNTNSDKLYCDTSFMDSNSLDMEIYNTSGKTDILFSPPRFSYKKPNAKSKKNNIDVSESEKFRQKLRSSESCDDTERGDIEQISGSQKKRDKIERKNRSRSRSKTSEENNLGKSSFKADGSNIKSKSRSKCDKTSRFLSKQSPNKSLELKIVLNPLSKSVLSNYSFDNKDNPCTKQKMTCQQFLEHEKQNIFVPIDETIINKILGDWDNSEPDFEPITKNNSRFLEKTPNKFLSTYEFNELSPDILKEKLKYKKKCRSAIALLSEQTDLNNHPKNEVLKDVDQIDTEQKPMESVSEESKNEINTTSVKQNDITKEEEKSFIEVEDLNLNFSVIQYKPFEKESGAGDEQGILIFETSSNLELVASKKNTLLNDGTFNKNKNENSSLAENSTVNLNVVNNDTFNNDIENLQSETNSFSNEVVIINQQIEQFNPAYDEMQHSINIDVVNNSNKNKGNTTCDNDVSNIVLNISNPEECLDISIDDTKDIPNCVDDFSHQTYNNGKHTESYKSIKESAKSLKGEVQVESELADVLNSDLHSSTSIQGNTSKVVENCQNNAEDKDNQIYKNNDSKSNKNNEKQLAVKVGSVRETIAYKLTDFIEISEPTNKNPTSRVKPLETNESDTGEFLYRDELPSILSNSEAILPDITLSSDDTNKEVFMEEDNTSIKKKHGKKLYTKCRTSMRLEKAVTAVESENQMNDILDNQINDKNIQHETNEGSDQNKMYFKRRTSMRLITMVNEKETQKEIFEVTGNTLENDNTEHFSDTLVKHQRNEEVNEISDETLKTIENCGSVEKKSNLVLENETGAPKVGIIHTVYPQKTKEILNHIVRSQDNMETSNKSENSLLENIGIDHPEEILMSPTKRKRGRPRRNNIIAESASKIVNVTSLEIKELDSKNSHTPNKLEITLDVDQKIREIVKQVEEVPNELRLQEQLPNSSEIDNESKELDENLKVKDLENIQQNSGITRNLGFNSDSVQNRRKSSKSSVKEDIWNTSLRRRSRHSEIKSNRNLNKKVVNETDETKHDNIVSDKNQSNEEMNTVSPKIFEGFGISEQPKDAKSNVSSLKPIHNIDLEQIEAELAAIECQKVEETISKFTKLTRSKSRAALPDAKDEVAKILVKDNVKTLQRSKTSLGLVLKDLSETSRRSRGRQRTTMDTGELETLKEKRRRSQSVVPSVMRHVTKTIKDPKEKTPVFKLGTLAWARVGGHPYWPCLVTKEPESNIFKKEIIKIGLPKTVYHVRFFGDKGKRAWVMDLKMMQYNNKDDVELLLQKAKKQNKPFSERSAYIIRNHYLAKWERAVNEAEELKGKTLAEKVDFFEQLDERRRVEKLERKNECPSTSKRKRKESISTICSDTSQITDFQDMSPTRKRYKKGDGNIKDDNERPNRNRSSMRKEKQNEKLNEDKPSTSALSVKQEATADKSDSEPLVIPPYVPILDNENILPSRTRSGLHSDGNSDIVSKVSSEKSEKSEVSDPFSIEAQKALFKRNNLFKGVSKERACQYCYQAGMVFKCTKGGCNGLYHLRCSIDVMSGKEYNKRKSKKKMSTHSAVIDHISKENDLNTSSNTETSEKNPPEDRVQIVTVTSHIYNTPPRKTFPDNFQAMTLAEQIDYKMKEVMKKFENETRYSESSADSSSEETGVTKMLSKIKQSPSLKIDFDNTTADKKSLDDSTIKANGKLSDIIRKSTRSVIKHVTADSVIEISSVESSPSTSRQNLIRHVTADSLTTEVADKGKTNLKKNLTSESDLERTPSESSCSTISQMSKEMFDPKNFRCGFCLSRLDPYCFICRKAVSQKGSSIRQKCSLYQCGRYYHPECLKLWPQTQWSLIQTTKHRTSKEEFDTFVCPQHVCHTCSSDDPRAATSRCSGDKIVKCLRCPSSYHSTNFCIPAGTEIISTTQVICPRHRDKNKATINTTWCFLCNEGGHLICCETCPTSVHPECMPVNLTDDDKFICEDCESGRLPLYDEIVWVKLGAFRWWPALILFPNEVPPNVMNARHSAGEFVVRFFGTYDHYWVSRSRSFLFQDGDAGQTTSTKKKVDEAFNRAVEEAVVAHKAKKEFKRTREVESLNSLKPPPYIRIKVNKPVGNVRHLDLDLSSTTSCDCDPNKPNPCEPDSDCLNRLLMTECNPEVCPAGQRCKNQSFEKREYPPMTPYKTEGRGWGLKTLAPIKKGQFVIEYVGELIDMEEYQRRILKMHEQKEENYYFLTIDKDRMIDAGPKGNMARFMNHCCQPNCETQKWTVNGDTRVGLFATRDIPAETELTFNYNLECVGKERKICRCGAPSCSGFIGVQKEKQDTEVKKTKKNFKKKKPVEQAILPPCFICQRKGTNVGLCNNKVCNKTYHLRCLNMLEWPEGNTFICPRHNCNICEKRTIRCCVKCVNSFCPSHSDGNIRYDNLLGFVCSSHDPTKPHADNPLRVRARKQHVITEETAVTSTTSEDSEKEEDLPLSDRLKTDKKDLDDIPLSKRAKKVKKRSSINTSDDEIEVSVSHSTSLPDALDENLVSSATPCSSEEGKRKKSAKRNDQTRKKIRLSKIVNNKKKSTARRNSNYNRQLDDR